MRIFGSILLILYSQNLFSQVALLDIATDLIQKKELQKALEALDKAEHHISTAKDARTYYLKAFTFKEQYIASESNKNSFRAKSISEIAKCRTLDTENQYSKFLSDLERFFAARTFNNGIELFNSNRYIQCISEFRIYFHLVKRENESLLEAHYYSGTSYYTLGKYDSALIELEPLKGKLNEPLLYVDLSTIYLKQERANEAISVIQQGLSHFPTNYDLQIAILNLYSGLGKYKELETQVESSIKDNPKNIEMMLLACTAYEKNKTDDTKLKYNSKTIKLYENILGLEVNNYDANYNLGVLYYNEAVDIINKNDIDIDIKLLQEILEKSTSLFEKALPFLLRIYNSSEVVDLKILTALQSIYYNLNMKPELNRINELIQNTDK